MIGIRKYLEYYERLNQLMIPSLSKEELIQKEKANLGDWKKVAVISSSDLSLVLSLENLMQVQHEQLDLYIFALGFSWGRKKKSTFLGFTLGSDLPVLHTLI